MKTAKEILKEHYPQTTKFLQLDHPIKYECVIGAMEKYANQFKPNPTCKYCGTEVESEGLACETCCVRGANLPYGGRLD